jgi:hypothetical protein
MLIEKISEIRCSAEDSGIFYFPRTNKLLITMRKRVHEKRVAWIVNIIFYKFFPKDPNSDLTKGNFGLFFYFVCRCWLEVFRMMSVFWADVELDRWFGQSRRTI